MSKLVETQVFCKICNKKFRACLHRSLWIEDTTNMQLIMDNQVNVVECPTCKQKNRIYTPFIATHAVLKYAVWYDPYHDDRVTEEKVDFIKMLGKHNYIARAVRIKDWEKFKQHILKCQNNCKSDLDLWKSISYKSDLDLWKSGSGYKHFPTQKPKSVLTTLLMRTSALMRMFIYSVIGAVALGALFIDRADEFIASLVVFILFTFPHLWLFQQMRENWNERTYRRTTFAAITWAILWLLYVLIIDPYALDESLIRQISLGFVPASVSLFAAVFYHRYIK